MLGLLVVEGPPHKDTADLQVAEGDTLRGPSAAHGSSSPGEPQSLAPVHWAEHAILGSQRGGCRTLTGRWLQPGDGADQ